MHARVGARVGARPDGAGDNADREKDPPDHDRALIHAVEHLQRRQPRVEKPEVLRLDFLEQQYVRDADHAGEREARVREEQRRDVDAEQRAPQHRRGAGAFQARPERGDRLQRDQQRQDEYAHRPLIGGHLRIEIREREQPDERRDRRRRARDRHVARFHRLHPDDEGVRQRRRDEQRRRRAPDRGIALREVPDVRDEGRGVQRQGNEIHQCDVGAKYPCLVRAVRFGRPMRTTMRRQAPSRRGLREV